MEEKVLSFRTKGSLYGHAHWLKILLDYYKLSRNTKMDMDNVPRLLNQLAKPQVQSISVRTSKFRSRMCRTDDKAITKRTKRN